MKDTTILYPCANNSHRKSLKPKSQYEDKQNRKMTREKKSVYIHIPFCNTICTYCDFCKFYYQKKWIAPYLSHLKKEIEQNYKQEPIRTLYIGGGTPSALSKEELNELFTCIQVLDLSQCEEFTFECNIESITEEKAQFLYEHQVNRISIGVETFHPKHLKTLNRNHTKQEVKQKINMLKQIGFQNINVDFIYALPNETLEEVKEDIKLFLELDIPHISTYSLMIEPSTILGIQKTIPINSDLDAKMYQEICNTLKEHGFKHYEISNFTRPGYASKHNLVYWNNEEYYGFGVGASGHIEKKRYDNTRNISKYLTGITKQTESFVTRQEQIENECILGFRKIEGISKKKFIQKYQYPLEQYSIIKKLLQEGKLEQNETHIYIKEENLYTSNGILCELIGCEEFERNYNCK